MILKCECFNSTADALYGKGWRPHTKLATSRAAELNSSLQEHMCEYCYWVRTLARGRKDGQKNSTKAAQAHED